MYLIIRHKHKDVAKVWQEGDVTKVQAFDASFQERIEQIVYEAKKWLHEHDEYFELQAKKQGKKRSKPKIGFLRRLGYFLEPTKTPIPPSSREIEDEEIEVDWIDEKTDERWSMSGIGIAKDDKSQRFRRAK